MANILHDLPGLDTMLCASYGPPIPIVTHVSSDQGFRRVVSNHIVEKSQPIR